MQNKLRIFLLIISCILFFFLYSCSSSIYSTDEFPNEDLQLEWEQISKDEAKKLFLSYQTEVHEKATVYERYPGNKIRKFPDCTVEKNLDSTYNILIIQMTFSVTLNLEELQDNFVYYKAKSDSSFIKMVPTEENSLDNMYIYKDGWLVEQLVVNNQPNWHDFCDDLIIYKD